MTPTSVRSVLDRFDEIRKHGPYDYPHHHHHDGGRHDLHIAIGAIIHGNEVGSLPSVISLIEGLNDGSIDYGGRLTILLGNPEAAIADRRFLDVDLNRVFVDNPPPGHESDRSRELMPILDDVDVFFDIHQTILKSERPFYTFPFDPVGWRWARAVGGASTWVTRKPGQTFSDGTVNTDEYVRNQNKPGVTLELGAMGFSDEAEALATAAFTRLLVVAEEVGSGRATIEDLAEQQPELEFVGTSWIQQFTDPTMQLRPGLWNFCTVVEGENLSAEGTPAITAPCDGMVLFPKYPVYDMEGRAIEPRPGEIVRIVAPLDRHPLEIWT